MSFIDKLVDRWNMASDFSDTRINLMRAGVITLAGIKRLESEALFVSTEGLGTLRETAKVEFAGKERYWWLARKYNGVLGGLNTDKNLSMFSRLKVQDLISVQPYEYDEKFRVRLPDDPGANPTPFQEIIVPPGTEFPFVVRLIKPSKQDLMLFLYGNQIADGLGYGNYSKLRGNSTTDWFFIANGFAHLSVYRMLSSEESLAEELTKFSERPFGVNVDDILKGDTLHQIINEQLIKCRRDVVKG
jgi:hypothetical protein